jgi:hypothetical protein
MTLALRLLKDDEGGNMHLDVTVRSEAVVASMGLLLALCTKMPAGRQCPLTRITLDFWGLWGSKGFRKAEDLLGPLRLLAESCSCHEFPSLVLQPFRGRGVAESHPLGHLQLFWDRFQFPWRYTSAYHALAANAATAAVDDDAGNDDDALDDEGEEEEGDEDEDEDDDDDDDDDVPMWLYHRRHFLGTYDPYSGWLAGTRVTHPWK